jgi:hypothetical protein
MTQYLFTRRWRTTSASIAVLALALAGSAPPVAAQPANPEACSAAIDLAYLKSDGVDKDAPPSQAFIDLAMQQPLVQMFCAPAGQSPTPDPTLNAPTDGAPNPARSDAPAAEPQTGTPTAAVAPADDGPDNRVDTDRSACILVTVSEVGAAMKQSVTATPADPFGVAGAQGCEFNGAGPAFADIMYIQANGAMYYDSFRSTAEAKGVQAVPGLGDRAFSYLGDNGPGLVVAKGDKLVTLEFNGIGSGPAEKSSLFLLAQQALGRVH